jgi:hypothetical protein
MPKTIHAEILIEAEQSDSALKLDLLVAAEAKVIRKKACRGQTAF